MSIFDPIYGELFTARETCEATGFTMNQLRNWRLPARLDKAPFGFVSVGTTPYYRKASVQKFLDTNAVSNVRYSPAGADLDVPIDEALASDSVSSMALRMLSAIQPETVNAYFERFSRQDEALAMRYMNSVKNEFLKEAFGEGWDSVRDGVLRKDRFAKPEWFPAAVKAMRLLANELQAFGLSRDEILAIPVGLFPPVNEVKKV